MEDGVVCFTGSRTGPTAAGRKTLRYLLRILYGRGFRTMHNGVAVGADEAAALLAKECSFRVVGFPSDVPSQVSAAACEACDELRPVAPPLDRNKTMLDEGRRAGTAILLACPAGEEVTRSGTWATIRYSRKVGVPRWLIQPNGDMIREGDGDE